jgi:hypothetical protein
MLARRQGALVPGQYLREGWWREGPFLLESALADGSKLVEWIAARVDEVRPETSTIHLRGATLAPGGSAQPVVALFEVPFEQFDTWARHEIALPLEAGRFVEIGKYSREGRGRGPAERLARVHVPGKWTDEGLPPEFPDPTRYLRHVHAG